VSGQQRCCPERLLLAFLPLTESTRRRRLLGLGRLGITQYLAGVARRLLASNLTRHNTHLLPTTSLLTASGDFMYGHPNYSTYVLGSQHRVQIHVHRYKMW
jgi:hypothetical protein